MAGSGGGGVAVNKGFPPQSIPFYLSFIVFHNTITVIDLSTANQYLMHHMRQTINIDLGGGIHATAYSDTVEKLKLLRHKWTAQVHKRGYIYAATYLGTTVYLHRLIARAKPGQKVDHINRNTLDCRDDNLRIATSSQNAANSEGRKRYNASGFKGVTWSKRSHRWAATITKDGWRYYLGLFQHKRRAAVAVDRAALALFGEFAGLNFPGRKTRAVMPTGGFRVR